MELVEKEEQRMKKIQDEARETHAALSKLKAVHKSIANVAAKQPSSEPRPAVAPSAHRRKKGIPLTDQERAVVALEIESGKTWREVEEGPIHPSHATIARIVKKERAVLSGAAPLEQPPKKRGRKTDFHTDVPRAAPPPPANSRRCSYGCASR